MCTRRGGAAELDRVADQVLEELAELRGVAGDDGQRVVRDHRLGFSDAGVEVVEHVGDDELTIDRREAVGAGADARVGEEIADQRLHARHRRAAAVDEAQRVAVQPIAVAPSQELGEARDRAQRLLEVVRGE
jgi:hypothetical protein